MDIWVTVFLLIVGLFAASGFMLILVGYVISLLASVSHGWRWWVPALLLPVLGGLWFCAKHWGEHRKTGLQLGGGALSLILGVGLLYGAGPSVVNYIARNVQTEAASGETNVVSPPSRAAPSAATPAANTATPGKP